MHNWDNFIFCSVNDLTHYESEINKLAGSKSIYTYTGTWTLTAWAELDRDYVLKTYVIEPGAPDTVEELEFRRDETEISTENYIRKMEIIEIATNTIVAMYNCSESLEGFDLIDISGNENNSTGSNSMIRSLQKVKQDWNHYIENAINKTTIDIKNVVNRISPSSNLDETLDDIKHKQFFKPVVSYLALSNIFSDLAQGLNSELYTGKSVDYLKKSNAEFGDIVSLLTILNIPDNITSRFIW